ncbi:MAG TPA: 1-(5-phosphoribosyl)-5-[(5-phosphoribosylamino)methylideneamino] imidazole-4-carboxamide isomerase [Longimicrobiales bacterium]|nr:1-(5-phosphoribosyl)-5-[(5-phosphoribosylamino)methylideneamino] imidazole-4-carboxamide isomerase [Longimicrobiales bacterium]
MIAVPAIDLRGGRVVQLVGGEPGTERVSLPDPASVAARWERDGFAMLHVVDLDAALGTGSNHDAVRAVLDAVGIPVQVGGGVRSDEDVEALLGAGAARVVVGTRAIEDARWLERITAQHPGRVVLAADTRDGRVVTRGWTASTALATTDLVARVGALPLAAVLVTDVGREGRMEGADVVQFETLVETSRQPLIASGGIADSADLTALAAVGVHAVVLGMALYTGALDAPVIARSYQK